MSRVVLPHFSRLSRRHILWRNWRQNFANAPHGDHWRYHFRLELVTFASRVVDRIEGGGCSGFEPRYVKLNWNSEIRATRATNTEQH